VIAEALRFGLLEDGNIWSEIIEMRNLTSHTYDAAIDAARAKKVYDFVRLTGAGIFSALLQKLESYHHVTSN
jgi:hypothetical protein